jgi:hypothetical protein
MDYYIAVGVVAEAEDSPLAGQRKAVVTDEEIRITRDLVAALQLLLSSFTLTHKPARISVTTAKGWFTGTVDDGTELAIQQATNALRQSAQFLKRVDPEWKHALDGLIPPKRSRPRKRNPNPLSSEEMELSALFELRWVASWLNQLMNGDLSVTFVQAKRRVDSFLQRIEDRG